MAKKQIRTGTKVMIALVIWLGLIITFLVVGIPLLSIKYKVLTQWKDSTDKLITALTGGQIGAFLISEGRKLWENIRGIIPGQNDKAGGDPNGNPPNQ